MTEHSEAILRQALDSVDRLRKRQLVAMGITAAISQIAWLAFVLSAEHVTERMLLILATFALAMTVFGGVFMLVIHTTRMTHRILQAIEIGARRGE
jgi:threonine/homoserine/homoserine lactone efflux protein